MESLNNAAGDVLRRLLASQPTTPAKVAFAWRMAAGDALGRAGDPCWREDGVLVVRASSDAWRREIRRATPMLLARVRELVGVDVVRKIVIE
jgi:predicted nucleic acid-binding Zn ribbon protein